jgi:phage gpG-like protein
MSDIKTISQIAAELSSMAQMTSRYSQNWKNLEEICKSALEQAFAAGKASKDKTDSEEWKHKKRGTTYSIVGDVRVQCETPLQDDEMVLLYQSTQDGSYGCRRHSEFHDGRFEKTK